MKSETMSTFFLTFYPQHPAHTWPKKGTQWARAEWKRSERNEENTAPQRQVTSLHLGSTWCCSPLLNSLQRMRLMTTGKVPGNYLLHNYSFFNHQSTCNSILTLNKQNSTLDLRNHKKFYEAIWSSISSLHFLGKDYSGIFKSICFSVALPKIYAIFL